MTEAASDRVRWLLSLGLAVVLHAAVFVLWIAWPRPPSSAPPAPMQAVMLEMAPTTQAPPAPPAALPAGPPQRQQPRQRAAQRPRVARQPPLPHAPSQDALPHVESARDTSATVAARSTHEVDQSTAPPSLPAPPSTRLAAPRAIEAAGHTALVTWASLLLGHLAQYRRYPIQAERAHQQGIAWVRFAVNRKGEVLHAELERGSGHAMLDREALATIHRASPVPGPPAAIPGDPVEVTLPVVFSLQRE